MLAAPSDSDAEALAQRLAEDMAQRWRQGERPIVEDYLERHPELLDFPEAVAELIYEEICLRQDHGEPTDRAEVLSRFPQWQPQLQIMLDCHQLVMAGGAPPVYPEVGEILGEFRLAAELGRGAQGRVFLATQPGLADRPVVLKLVPLLGREHLSLARLQHTHVVPLYFVQDFPDRALRALCLPYFGGASLAALLETLRGIPMSERSGQVLVDAIRRAQAASLVALPVRGPACRFLAGKSYADAACWIVACLANALQHAHERGLLHLDLKPANVLLAADAQPMLLDFHLARPPLAPGALPPDWLGGTPAYMPPEQRAAWQAVHDGQPISAALDGRSDLYALGVVLYEMLAGAVPESGVPAQTRLQQLNPGVTSGLAAVVGKCLAANAHDRYPDAAALAEDLGRHLRVLPLRGVSGRSWRERWRTWRLHRPHAPIKLALLAAIVLVLCVAGWHVHRQFEQGRDALREGQELMERQEYERAGSAFRRGLAVAEIVPFANWLRRDLRGQLHEGEAFQAAGELHRFVERVRFAEGSATVSPDQARTVEGQCRALWQQRDRIKDLIRETADANASARDDLLDLAITWTGLLVRLAPPHEADAARKEALDALAEAEKLCGPSCILYEERARHAAALGLGELAAEASRRAAALAPRTPWEHVALGRDLLATGNAADALAHFEQALAVRPDDLWANYHGGRCAHLLGRHDEALAAFTACIALAPRSGWCHYNRGLTFVELGRQDRALHDFDRALTLDPRLADAALARGLLHYREKRYDAAIADLRRALENGASAAAVHHGLALVHLARGEQEAAISELNEVLKRDPEHEAARRLLERIRRPG